MIYYMIKCSLITRWVAFLVAQWLRIWLSVQETRVQTLGWEDPLEKEMVTHSSILFLPGKSHEERSSGLQSTGSQRFGIDLVTKEQQNYYMKTFYLLLYMLT